MCAHSSTLFRVKLGTIKVVFCHCCSKIDIIKTVSNRIFIGNSIIAMYQIKMTLLGILSNTSCHVFTLFQPMCGTLRVVVNESLRYQRFPGPLYFFFRAVAHQPHSQTNSQTGCINFGISCIQLGTFKFCHRRTRFPTPEKIT